MDIFIDIALSIDRTIYTWIPYVYNLIVKLAGYEVFSPEQINGLSRRVYALLGIFMLFKLSFSMISYVVNPDEFSDKTKGFGGLIKNVIISMVLIVAVPYIFIEAYNVQKMILEDGTIIKLVLPVAGANDEENSDRSSIAYANRGAGEEISFILFTQFAKPNDVIVSIKDSCRRLYALDESGNRIHTTNSEYAYALDSECDEVLKGLFENSTEKKSGAYQYYKDAMEYENYNILVNHPEIFRAEVNDAEMYVSASAGKSVKSKVKVIKYNWILSFIIGIVVLLFLITLCIDVATRTIKLAFYQIIAPIPIISRCDPKAKKDGMFNKWVKACFATYLDLYIRLFVFFLAIFIIRAFSQKLYSNNSDAAVIVFIIIGALVFAKQAPKIIEDLTGLKIENFTLNPFKKFTNEALGGKAILGAAGGALAGIIGGGPIDPREGFKAIAGRGLSTIGGAVRGAAANKGFGAGINAQAEVNRKVRDARINGASFLGSRLAGVASTFGLEDATLERQATLYESNKAKYDKVSRDFEERKNGKLVQKKEIQNRMAARNRQKAGFDRLQGNIKGMEDRAIDQITKNAAGEISKIYSTKAKHAKYMEDNIGLITDANGNTWDKSRNEYIEKSLANNELYIEYDKDNQMEIIKSKANNAVVAKRITAESAARAQYEADHYLNEVGKYDYMTQAIAISKGQKTYKNLAGQIVATDTDDKTLMKSYYGYQEALENLADDESGFEAAEGFKRDAVVDGKSLHTQYGQSKGIIGHVERSMYADEDDIKKIDDAITKMETTTLTGISGWYYDEDGDRVHSNNLTYEQAAKYLDAEKKDLDYKKAKRKPDRDRAAAERFKLGG